MRTLLTLALSYVAAASSAGAQSVDETIDQAIAAWRKVTTMRATFEQTIMNPITGSAMLARGSFQQRKPHQLSITFTEPKDDRIVADGKFVWVYLQSATPGQVLKMTMADAGASNTDLLGQFLDAPKSKYDIVDAGMDSVAGRRTRALVLTAKPGQSLPFVRAKVWIDPTDSMLRQFESTESTGLSRRVRLLTIAPNAAVDSGAFVFKVPAGARVVEPMRQP
jgi:outer membrane lipoprotein carrier protein